jgi:Fe-S cluster assembly protein SufD
MFDFKNHLAKLNKEPQWLKDKRIQAWEKFSQLPMPYENEEAWRLLDLDMINLDDLQPCAAPTKKLANVEELGQYLSLYEHINEFVHNPAGVLIESPQGMWHYLDEQFASQGVIVTPLSEALDKHGELLKPYLSVLLGKVTEEQNNLTQNNSTRQSNELVSEFSQSSKFALLNQAICPNAMIVYVPKNVVIDKPFICLNLLKCSVASLNLARLLIIAEQHSQISVVNVLTTDIAAGGVVDNKPEPAKTVKNNGSQTNHQLSLTNFLLQVFIEPGAELNYAEIQNFDKNTFAISHSYYTQEQDSRLHSLVAALGGGQLKGEVRNILKGRGAESNLNGIVLGSNNERFNFNTIEDHIAPDTKSSIDFRVALKDEAQSIYHGNIQVSKTAQKTDAYQSNKNLLLGAKAHADSIPKLEILADDVKCSHGATVGPVDRNQVFYLMTRGLNESQAEELIVNGFFHQTLADCPIAGVADWLDSLVAKKIQTGTITSDAKELSANKKQPALTR